MKEGNLHVANVIHYLHHGGGVAIQALNMAKHIAALNISTSFSTMQSKVPDHSCVKLIARYSGRIYTSRRSGVPLDPLLLFRNLKTSLRTNHCNVIQAFDPLVSGLASYLVKTQHKEIPLAIRLGTNYSAHFSFQYNRINSGSLMKDINNISKRRLLLPVLTSLERTTLGIADAVVANCEYLGDVYRERYPKFRNITVIRNGVDIDTFTPNGPSDKLGDNKLSLLYVGRIEERKGLDRLLLAMSKVFKKHPECRLSLIGRALDPKYQSRLEKLAKTLSISSKIRFLGAFDNQLIPGLMRSADILVFPSSGPGVEIEGLPNSVLEGLATGLSIVASRVCGIPEVIKDGQNGLLYTPGSTDEFVSSLIKLIDSSSYRTELGNTARRLAVKNNSNDVTANRYLNLYQHLISKYSKY